MVFATLSQKRYQKTRTKNIAKRKHRHIVLLTKPRKVQDLPKIKGQTRAEADARATLLLLILLLLPLLTISSLLLLLLLYCMLVLLLLVVQLLWLGSGIKVWWFCLLPFFSHTPF